LKLVSDLEFLLHLHHVRSHSDEMRLRLQRLQQREGAGGMVCLLERGAFFGFRRNDRVNAFAIGVKFVVAVLVPHRHDNQHADCHADSQPKDVEGGELLVAEDLPPGEV
jgi:hypothetical protein